MTVAATQMALPVTVGRLVADSPPVALLLSYELLLQQHNGTGGDLASQPSAPVLFNPSTEATHDDDCPVPD